MGRIHLVDIVADFFGSDIKSSEDYRKIFSDIKTTSYDDNGKTPLINSKERCLDFDKIKTVYFKEHGKRHKDLNKLKYSDYPYTKMNEFCSNDAVAIFEEMDYFIEFKNKPDLDNKKDRITEKIKDSVLIYLDILDEKLSYTRDNLGYILVYNPSKSDKEIDKINAIIKRYGQKEIDKFGLRANYEDFYFKRVRIMPKEDFEIFLKNKDK